MRPSLTSTLSRVFTGSAISIVFRFIAVAMLFLAICPRPAMTQESETSMSLSIVSLLANPEKYDGKRVKIIGYVNIETEGTAVYLHKEDKIHSIYKNAIALHLGKSDLDNSKKINGNYALIDGVFDANTGHMGLFSGSIHSVRRIAPMLSTH